MDSILERFEQAAAAVEFSSARMTVISNVTGRAENQLLQSSSYWRRHARECVRFSDGIRAVLERGPHIFLEIGPQPVLTSLVAKQLPEQKVHGSLRAGFDDREFMLETAQALYANGVPIDWSGVDRGCERRKVSLPAYPFQRKHHWFGPVPAEELAANRDLAWSELTGAAEKQSELGPLGWNILSYQDRWNALDRLTSAHIRNALVRLGAFRRPGESLTASELIESYGVPRSYLKLLDRRLRALAAAGVIAARGDRFESPRPLELADLAPLWREVETLLAGNPEQLAYIRQCGSKLDAVLAGRESPLETLFPDGSFELAEGLYERSSEARYSNPIIASGVQAAARVLSRRTDLRVLEIGGGTGSATAALLPVLPPRGTEYWFTDVSDRFLARASEKFADFPSVRYVRLDLDRPFEQQGVPANAFDFVIAANVVHAVPDLGAALARLRAALVPGGALVLLEATEHHAWFDMTTGLIEGWQKFDDGWRFDHPLLPPERWLELLRSHGFEDAERYPKSTSHAEVMGQHVIVARTPPRAGGSELQGAPLEKIADLKIAELKVADLKINGRGHRPDAGMNKPLLQSLDAAQPVERLELMTDYVRGVVKRVLRLSADRELGAREGFTDLGMDSLMALELKGALARGLGRNSGIPSTIAFDTGTSEALAEALLAILFPEALPEEELPTASATRSGTLTVEELSEMSDEEVEALMRERLQAN